MIANKKSQLDILCIIFMMVVAVFITFNVHILESGDDHTFINSLNSRSLFEYLNIRYHTWTGRIPVEALISLTIVHAAYWKIAIPVSFFIISYSLSNLAGFNRNSAIWSTCIVSVLMLLININVMTDAGWWVTGSYYYLQPIAAGLFSLVIYFTSKDRSVYAKSLAIILIAFSCFNEQFSVLVAFPLSLIYSIYNKELSKFNISYISVVCISTAISLSAPGNAVRTKAEIFNWMPDYQNLNMIDKVALGFDRMSSHITEPNTLFSVFLAILLYCSIKCGMKSKAQLYSSIVIVFKLAISMIQNLQSTELSFFTNSEYISFGEISSFLRFTPYIFSLLIIFSALTLLTSMCREVADYMLLPIPFILGILSVIVIGFSPTVYASAYRVLFIFNLYIVYISSALIRGYLKGR